MKVFIGYHMRGQWLIDELEAAGVRCVPFQVSVVRRHRRANKKIVAKSWIIRDMVFADTERVNWRWVRHVWVRNDKYVEISEQEIEELKRQINRAGEEGRKLGVGEIVTVNTGPFAGLRMRVRSIKRNKINGVLLISDQEWIPMSLSIDSVG